MARHYAHIDFEGLKIIRKRTIDPNTLQPILQSALAKAAGMTQGYYSRLEKGRLLVQNQNTSKDWHVRLIQPCLICWMICRAKTHWQVNP